MQQWRQTLFYECTILSTNILSSNLIYGLFLLCLLAFSRGYMGGPPQHQGPPVHMGQMAPGPPLDMRGPPIDMRGPHMGEPRNMMGDPRGPMMMEPRVPPMEVRGSVTLI